MRILNCADTNFVSGGENPTCLDIVTDVSPGSDGFSTYCTIDQQIMTIQVMEILESLPGFYSLLTPSERFELLGQTLVAQDF